MTLNQVWRKVIILILTLSFSVNFFAQSSEQELKVALRTVAHEFLVQLEDSTSRILPIKKIGDRYLVEFEKEFSFEPDFLMLATFKAMEKFNLQESFVVEVEGCDSNYVVHSFIANFKDSNEDIACKLRESPASCYQFYFTVIENKALINSYVSEEKYNSWWWVAVAVLIIISCLLFIKSKKHKVNKTNSIKIGKFQFDPKGMTLNLEAQTIDLSTKEADLLKLLYENENKTLEREQILNLVWGDEGDYVGRTLDVFISKLRKKLEADPTVKIVNVRGVGYRLVVND